MCKFKVFLAPNLTVSRAEIEAKPERFDHFMKIDREKGKLYLNHSNYNLTDIAMKENVTLPMWLRAVSLGNKTVSRKVIINFNHPWSNTAPKIDDVKKRLKVSVKQEDIEKGLNDKFATYVSKKAYDKEGDKPIISIKGIDLPCKCATFQQ